MIDPLVAEILEFENVYRRTDARTDGHTDGRRIDRYTISSPCEPSAQVSCKYSENSIGDVRSVVKYIFSELTILNLRMFKMCCLHTFFAFLCPNFKAVVNRPASAGPHFWPTMISTSAVLTCESSIVPRLLIRLSLMLAYL